MCSIITDLTLWKYFIVIIVEYKLLERRNIAACFTVIQISGMYIIYEIEMHEDDYQSFFLMHLLFEPLISYLPVIFIIPYFCNVKLAYLNSFALCTAV